MFFLFLTRIAVNWPWIFRKFYFKGIRWTAYWCNRPWKGSSLSNRRSERPAEGVDNGYMHSEWVPQPCLWATPQGSIYPLPSIRGCFAHLGYWAMTLSASKSLDYV